MTDPMPTLRELFEATLALPADERTAYLDTHCRDAAQRAAVERLLEADEEGGARVLDQPFDDLLVSVGDLEADAVTFPAGLGIGPFTLIDKLGEGGSSVVFRAERAQEGVSQTVALKLLRRGIYTAEDQRRFRSERQALSQLRHHGIARLIEGGVTDTGVPYIALELVDGEPITVYARNRQLSLDARLALFIDVCRAVEAAHRALIVHRDLKPSNVLVTREGEVKLLDFGIAKLLDADNEGDETRTLHQAMTPAYAAPEQFAHGQITTATDVYALGVLLAELMTGTRREHGDTRTPSSTIGEDTDPAVLPAPPRSIRRQLRGDLDNIVLKATDVDPERRYASAGAFADDIERHREGQPVIAHPPSHWYRASKFVARHRGGVATTAAFLLAVLASLGIALWQAEIAREQARLARDHAQRAEAVRDLLVDLFDAEIPSRPKDETPGTAELLARGAERATSDLAETPAVQSELLVALARVYDHLAQPDKGVPLVDAAVAAARRVEPPDPALLGAALSERGEADLSQNHFDDAIARLDEAAALQSRVDENSLALALTLDRRALGESQTGKHDKAIADYESALAIRRKQLPEDDAEILNSYDALGNAYVRAGRIAEGAELLRKAADGAQAKFGERHVKTAHYLKNVAMSQGMLRHYAQAAALTERAVAIERELYPPGSPDVVNGLNNLGSLDLALGKLGAARATLEEGRERNRAAGLDESLGQTFVVGNLARVHEAQGDLDGAAALLDEAKRTAVKVVGEEHARTRVLEFQAARVAFLRDASTAAALARVAQAIVDHPENLAQFRSRTEPEARYALGLAQAALGNDDAAAATWKAAVAALPTDHVDPMTLPLVADLARYEAAHGESDAAATLLRDTIGRAASELPASHFELGDLHLALAETIAKTDAAAATKELDAAEAAFVELPENHPLRVRAAALRVRLHAS